MEEGDHLRQAVLGCFDSIFTSAANSAARTKAIDNVYYLC